MTMGKLQMSLGVVAFALAGFAGNVDAGPILFVDDDASADGNGQSWATAYRFLQDALAAAEASGGAVTEIWVAKGTYRPDCNEVNPAGTRDPLATFRLLNGVVIRGGFAGNEDPATFDLDSRDFETNSSILSGIDRLFRHVVTGSGTDATAVLDGFRITYGGSWQEHDTFGGGMLNINGHPTVMNCIFRYNGAKLGGGMYNDGANPTLINCDFIGNMAYGDGGGMYNTNFSQPTLVDCTFIDNLRGGMANWSSSPSLTNCVFHGNSSYGMLNMEMSNPDLAHCHFTANLGGGMQNYFSDPMLYDCTFTDNTFSSVSAGTSSTMRTSVLAHGTFSETTHAMNSFGSGMYNDFSNPTLINCVLSRNHAPPGLGGGMHNGNLSSPILYNCTLDQNFGDAISNVAGSAAVLYNCTLTRNGSNGISNFDMSMLVLYNCLVARNSGGGVLNAEKSASRLYSCTLANNQYSGMQTDGGGIAELINCVVWGNGNRFFGEDSQIFGPATVMYSCVEGGWPGEGNLNADPRFLDPAGGDFRFRVGSPCIDAGDNTAVPFNLNHDLAGNRRQLDDPTVVDTGKPGDPPRPVVDMGAYEFPPVVGDRRIFVDDDAPPGGDGTSWASAFRHLQDALAAARDRAQVTEIWVAAGVYRPDRDAAHPDGSGLRTAAFELLGGVALYGGFAGNEDPATFDLAHRDLRNNPTVLSGDLAGDDGPDFANITENSHHVLVAVDVGASARLDGFRIQGSNADQGTYSTYGGRSLSDGYGGGLHIAVGSPTVANCIFIQNKAASGAGVYCGNGSPLLINCAFAGNTASGMSGGGGVRNFQGTPTLVNCTISGNTAGGLISTGAQATAVNCILWGNSNAQVYGSAVVMRSCVQGGFAGWGNIGLDPLFVDAAGGDLRLLPGSPCIDAGSSAAVPAGTITDLDSHPRRMDDPATPDCPVDPGTCGPGPIVDMGAYEYVPPMPGEIPGDTDGDGDVDADDVDAFVACISGPAVPMSPDCAGSDLDGDGDTDQSDYGLFQRCFSGRDMPGWLACAE